MALTKEERNEFLFLVVERLKARTDRLPSDLKASFTFEQHANLPQLLDRIDVACLAEEPERYRIKTDSMSA